MKPTNPIKGVLTEELANSERMLTRYQETLQKLPKGALVEKEIKGRVFHYLAIRQKDRVRFVYKGRLDAKTLAEQRVVQKRRAQYRKLVSELRKQIRFLKRALHERKRRTL